jgi:hypothetical protein
MSARETPEPILKLVKLSTLGPRCEAVYGIGGELEGELTTVKEVWAGTTNSDLQSAQHTYNVKSKTKSHRRNERREQHQTGSACSGMNMETNGVVGQRMS